MIHTTWYEPVFCWPPVVEVQTNTEVVVGVEIHPRNRHNLWYELCTVDGGAILRAGEVVVNESSDVTIIRMPIVHEQQGLLKFTLFPSALGSMVCGAPVHILVAAVPLYAEARLLLAMGKEIIPFHVVQELLQTDWSFLEARQQKDLQERWIAFNELLTDISILSDKRYPLYQLDTMFVLMQWRIVEDVVDFLNDKGLREFMVYVDTLVGDASVMLLNAFANLEWFKVEWEESGLDEGEGNLVPLPGTDGGTGAPPLENDSYPQLLFPLPICVWCNLGLLVVLCLATLLRQDLSLW